MTGGFFSILDDIATLLDDAATMSKVAAKKTAGILGDDLAVNAEKATGYPASRELPVLWAITKGSFVNKLIILPLAFLLTGFLPQLIVPIFLFGGAYLSFEGAEKIIHVLTGCFMQRRDSPAAVKDAAPASQDQERKKIASAVRTDFILSIEIVMIALGSVMEQPLPIKLLAVTFTAFLATVGVYGLVALIVRMDDAGAFLVALAGKMTGFAAAVLNKSGLLLISALPYTIRFLAIVGTIAMLLVGGGMYTHNIPSLHHFSSSLPAGVGNFCVGLVVGSLLFAVRQIGVKLRGLCS